MGMGGSGRRWTDHILPCIKDDLKSLREDFLINDNIQMLVMLSMATDEMIRLVAMYPDVWFMDTTAGKSVHISFYIKSLMFCIAVYVS